MTTDGAVSAPTLSFVVPAHDVGPYLERCVLSILDQADDVGGGVEVVVVDDGSADDTAAVAAAIAARDERVRVVTNPHPQGPGGARNTGLEHSTGRLVWFVDGDDWLLDGAVDAVVETIRVNPECDVVLVDHVRAYPSGRLAPSSSHEVLAAAPGRATTLADWPQAAKVLHTPWNKVVSRSLLERTGLRFSASPVYEDVAFTFGVLRAASAIVAVPYACYAYRTARPGALTRTSGAIHLVWADEWDAALRAAEGDSAVVREALFARMLEHGWSVLGLRDGRRVRGRDRRAFLAGFAALHRAHRPPGVRRDLALALGWSAAAEVRVIAAFAAWTAGRMVDRSAGLVRRRAS